MVIVINGPPGVGKTTISKLLAERLPQSICIHGDDLRAFAPDNAREFLGGGSTYRAAATLARTYLEMGARFVLFDYCFLRPSHVEYFTDALGEVEMHLFTLWATLPTVRARETSRAGRTPLGEAVEECYREMSSHLEVLGERVDAERDAAWVVASGILNREAVPLELNKGERTMSITKFGLEWEAAQKDDGRWLIFRRDPDTRKVTQTCAHAWVSIGADAIDVEMEIVDTPPIPPPTTNPDGSITTFRAWDIVSVRILVSDLILYDFLFPDLEGKTFARLTFRDKSTGLVVREYKDRKY